MPIRNPYWLKFNFNPWRARIPDCAIRAISAATGLDYREVCKRLKLAWKNGVGLIRKSGIQLTDIKNAFGEYCDIIEDFYDNQNFVPDEFQGTLIDQQMDNIDAQLGINDAPINVTLNEFVELFNNQGVFLVSTTGNPNATNKAARTGGHIVCVLDRKNRKHGFIDTWDSGEMLVDAYMRLKKLEPTDSPKHWRYDYKNEKFIL